MADLDQIVVLGTGEFARAFTARYRTTKPGRRVFVGSRDPRRPPTGRYKEQLGAATVTSIGDSLQMGDVIVLAIHSDHYATLLPYAAQLTDKILVDVSNDQSPESHASSAETLAELFPQSSVVKAFNTISTDVMASNQPALDPVYVCGSSPAAKAAVSRLASTMGFVPVDLGGLDRARDMETSSRRVFPAWGWPSVVLLVTLAFWVIFTLCRHFKLRPDPYTWDRLPTNVFNKIAGAVAMMLLSFVYIPGCLAAFYQLAKGTKHCDFPWVLDTWLRMRQKLGLFALLLASTHLMLSVSLMSPPYFPKWYLKKYAELEIRPSNETYRVKVPVSSRMNWTGEVCVSLGVLGFLALATLGVSTLPSVARLVTWREWRCLHKHLGFVCMLLTGTHVTVKGARGWLDKPVRDVIPTVSFLSCVLPWVTLLMRLVLYLPCVSKRLSDIRQGGSSPRMLPAKPTFIPVVKSNKHDGELSIVV